MSKQCHLGDSWHQGHELKGLQTYMNCYWFNNEQSAGFTHGMGNYILLAAAPVP
jgi:hypothetical protein